MDLFAYNLENLTMGRINSERLEQVQSVCEEHRERLSNMLHSAKHQKRDINPGLLMAIDFYLHSLWMLELACEAELDDSCFKCSVWRDRTSTEQVNMEQYPCLP